MNARRRYALLDLLVALLLIFLAVLGETYYSGRSGDGSGAEELLALRQCPSKSLTAENQRP